MIARRARKLGWTWTAVAVAAALIPTLATTSAQPPVFEQYQLVLLKRPAQATEYPHERLHEIQAAHLAHMTRLAEEGKLLIAGPFSDQDDESLRGMALYKVGSVEEARRLAAADPAVVAGRLEVEVLTWNVEEGYLAFPKRPAAAEGGDEGSASSPPAAPPASR
ncbi:MAG TPA: YciI family protein [Thermoanaerobaculia bacterium]|nr:YciI family protein [Thermoanaerobaculia bacterium]